MQAVEFRVLGPLEVVLGDEVLTPRGGKQRALLALLLLHANEVVPSERLIDDIWGDDAPASGLSALHVRVSQLRRALEAAGDVLVTRPPGYVLLAENVDSRRFERLLAAGRGLEPARAVEVLGEALALWRGPALADLASEPFAQAEVARLEELRLVCVEERIAAELALGRHRDVVGDLEALVATHPLRERLHGQLMLALYRSGRQADALAAYRSARDTLVGELGIEPGEELRALEQSILRQDAELATPAGPAAEPPAPALPAAAVDERKVVTVLFADLVGSTELTTGTDPE